MLTQPIDAFLFIFGFAYFSAYLIFVENIFAKIFGTFMGLYLFIVVFDYGAPELIGTACLAYIIAFRKYI